jgi:hypothetical protein
MTDKEKINVTNVVRLDQWAAELRAGGFTALILIGCKLPKDVDVPLADLKVLVPSVLNCQVFVDLLRQAADIIEKRVSS